MRHAIKRLGILSVEEYLSWEETQRDRNELVEGVPHAMAGASRVHNLLVGNLYALLRPHARAPGYRLYSERSGITRTSCWSALAIPRSPTPTTKNNLAC